MPLLESCQTLQGKAAAGEEHQYWCWLRFATIMHMGYVRVLMNGTASRLIGNGVC
jgi:hypothetical protein